MPDWSWIGSLLDFCAAYYTTQLVRCAAFSFVLIGLVMLLRKMLFSRRTFIRGLLWSSFLLIPFLGKLKLFYENEAVAVITGRITHGTMTCLWADRIYMAGILIAAVCIFGKRLRLRKSVAGMERDIKHGSVMSGQIAGLVKEEISCRQLIDSLVQETDALLKGAGAYV